MKKKQSNKTERKIPEFTVTPYIGFFDVYFRTVDGIHLALEQCCQKTILFPANRTDRCDCRLCTTMGFTGRDFDDEYEVYLSQYQQGKGYKAVARFKKTHPYIIDEFLYNFELDEFPLKRVQYVIDFESQKQEDLLDLITESIEISHNRTLYQNIHAYVETCEIAESKGSIIRLNIVVNYHNKTGVFRETTLSLHNILTLIKFGVFDQDIFLSALTNRCVQITDSQVESLKKQLQDTTNINGLRKIISRYVDDDSQCFKVHPLQSLFEKSIDEHRYNPPSYDNKKVVLNSEPDIIPELEYYLPV